MGVTEAFTCIAREDATSALLYVIRGVSRYVAVFVQCHDNECLDLFAAPALKGLFDALIQMVLVATISLS